MLTPERETDIREWNVKRDRWQNKTDNHVTELLAELDATRVRLAELEKALQQKTETAFLIQQDRNRLAARVKALREALEHISGNRGNLQECCRDAFQDDQLDNHDSAVASEALAADDKVAENEK